MKPLDLTAAILVIVGALNWGLVGAFKFDLVAGIFGTSILNTIVYVLVGIAGVYQLIRLFAPAKQGTLAHA